MRQPDRAATIAVCVALLLTTSVYVAGSVGYRDPSLRASMEIAVGIVGVIAALLVLGRFCARGRLGELVLGSALLTLGTSSIVAGVLPVLVSDEPGSWAVWARAPSLVLGTVALAASPFLLRRTLERRRRALGAALAAVGALHAGAALAAYLLAARLPGELAASVASGSYDWPGDIHPIVFAGHMLIVCLSAVASVGFTREADRTGDRLVRWIGIGCGLAAVAHLHYALYPSLYSDAVSIGDAFRLAFYACILVGAVREVADYQSSLTAAAVTEERRRLARDLHDGLAQELALLVTQARFLAMRHGELDGLGALEQTAQRALDESRLAIGALTRPGYEPLDVAVATVGEEIAHRMGTDVRFRLASRVDVEPALRDAIVRIVREAITNAVRHGGAKVVSVELENGSGLRLRVIDDGRGFSVDGSANRPSGFGLVSMRERAEALGGRLTVASRPGEGTRVELVLP